MHINFYLDKKSKKPEKTIFLYIRGIGSGRTLVFHTGQKIEPKYWDPEKQQAKRSKTGSPELNSFLAKLKTDIEKAHRVLLIENENISFEQLKEAIQSVLERKKPTDTNTHFFDAYESFISSQKSSKRPRTIQKYETLKAHLKSFEESTGNKISFDRCNLDFYSKLIDFFIDKQELTNNTIGKYVSTLKTFLNWSYDTNLNKYNYYKRFRVPNEKTDIIYLTEEELLKIYTLDLSNDKRLERVRDFFCFGCFTGQRFSDLAEIKEEHIKNNSWYLHVYKTKDKIDIPLSTFALEILNKYKGNSTPIPVISHQKTNDYLKEIGGKAELNELITIVRYKGAERIVQTEPKYNLLTTHTARRTFVTLSLEKGMRAETVMEITGHKDYKTFKKYIKITSKVKEKEMKQTWSKETDPKETSSNLKK